MEIEKDLLIKMSVRDKSVLETITKEIMDVRRFPKPPWRSEEIRRTGNALFMQKDHDAETHWEIFGHYCKSISLAPVDSELLAQAYGNRSSLLLHIHKYEECIKDIDRTLGISNSDVLRIKLLCRKVECMKKLGLPDYQSVLNVAESYAKKIVGDKKADVDKFIGKAKACSVNKSTIPRKQNDVLPQMDKVLNCISIEHNDKYGRHLVSKKNYNPGDFIFSDKLYATVLNEKMNYTHCNYCLKIGWSGIPCDHCSWAMFCSEECKKKAWDSFHDVECSLMFYLRSALLTLYDSMKVSLRMLLLGIREAGSIEKLREELKLVDQCTDNRCKGFYKNGEFTSCTIQSVYSLKSTEGVSQLHLDTLATTALIVLIGIVKHSRLIKNFKFEKVSDVVENEDLLFLGSLLLKLTAIKSINAHSFSQLSCFCKRLKSSSEVKVNECCQRGGCLTSLASLINHSCNPNASMIFREDKTVAVYALQPIKKNTQIFITYAGFYHNTYLKDRKRKLEKYNFICKCRACTEPWPPLFILSDADLVKLQFQPSPLETKLSNDCFNIFLTLDRKKMNFSHEDIKQLCKTIVKAKQLSEPNVLSATLRAALGEVYSRVYGWEPLVYAFGECNKV